MAGRPRPRGQRRIPQRRDRAPSDPYGTEHRKVRAAMLAYLASVGTMPCPLCQQPMMTGMRLHLHHSSEQAALMGLPGDQLVHAKCNLTAGGRAGAAITNRQSPAKERPKRVRKPLTLSTKPRELAIAFGTTITIADADRCATCKTGAEHQGVMASRCWNGTCGQPTQSTVTPGM